MKLSHKQFKYGSAQYIVLHAYARKKRGKGPSALRQGMNSRDSLAWAKTDLQDAHLGGLVSDSIRDLCVLAYVIREPVSKKLNEVVLTVTPGETFEQANSKYSSLQQAKSDAYKISPEYAASQELDRVRRLMNAQKLQEETEVFLALSGEDIKNVLKSLARLTRLLDNIYADKELSNAVHQQLLSWGFFPNVNCGVDFNGEDEENVAKYIIGQALAGFSSVGCPHPIAETFIERWLTKFYPGEVI